MGYRLVNTLEWRDGFGRYLSWAFPYGTNPSTASVFVPPVKASWIGCAVQAFYVLASYLLLALGALLVVYLSIKSFYRCQKVGFASIGAVTGFVGAGWLLRGAAPSSCGVAD